MRQSAGASIRLFAKGDRLPSAEQRLADLYATHAATSIRLAFLMTGDPEAAEDIAQEAFVRTFVRLQDRRSPDHLEAYLRRTVVNLAHDRHRKLRSARRFTERSAPSSHIHRDEGSALGFREMLQQLPHRQRAAVVLRYYEDLSEQDAADLLGCSPGALKQLVQRALNTLRKTERGERDG